MRRFAILFVTPLLLLPGRHAHSQVTLAVAAGANLATLAYAERSERRQPGRSMGGRLLPPSVFPFPTTGASSRVSAYQSRVTRRNTTARTAVRGSGVPRAGYTSTTWSPPSW